MANGAMRWIGSSWDVRRRGVAAGRSHKGMITRVKLEELGYAETCSRLARHGNRFNISTLSRSAAHRVAGLKLKLLCHAAARRYRHGESRLRAASWSGRILNQSHIVRKYMTRDCASCVLIAEVLIVDAK
jgi:hypothetical protein